MRVEVAAHASRSGPIWLDAIPSILEEKGREQDAFRDNIETELFEEVFGDCGWLANADSKDIGRPNAISITRCPGPVRLTSPRPLPDVGSKYEFSTS